MAIYPGEIILHKDLCSEEGGAHLTKGMNFRLKGGITVILMSLRKGAPYADRVEQDGKVLVYEGHDVPKNEAKNPKSVDQQLRTRRGKLTENGKFFDIAMKYKDGKVTAELIKVYEKIKDGIWAYNGVFELLDAWDEKSDGRSVFKFKLQVTDLTVIQKERRIIEIADLGHNRMIPTSVKLEVWKRDKGRCIQCGSSDNLHFDHILPYSKGGTSLKSDNIQLLCARHNLEKTNKII